MQELTKKISTQISRYKQIAAKRIALKFLRKAGIPFGLTSQTIQWNGKTLTIDNNASNLLHDLAHWQLCGKHRREMPDFGLGIGPESDWSEFKLANHGSTQPSISDDVADQEETKASCLGICYEYILGLSSKKTYREHRWHDEFGSSFPVVLQRLIKQGYLKYKENKLIPTFKVK